MNEQQQPKRNTTCLEAGQLTAWRDGALPLREADEVMAHLAGCARCAAEEHALTRDRHQVFDLLSRLDPVPNTHAEPAIALTRFQERLHARTAEPHHSNGDRNRGESPLSRAERDEFSLVPERPSTRIHRIGAFVQTLAAILVVGALVGAMLLLLASHRSEPGAGGVAEKGCIFTSTTGFVHEYDLSAVTALSRNDIWVVGGFYVPARDPHALLEHWNGSRWCIRPDPYPITGMAGTESVNLRAVAAASTNDVWAVGNVDDVPVGHALIEHWNGSRWSVTPNPINGGVLEGVAAVSSTDAWAVGSAVSGGRTLIEHWNGKQWNLIPNSFTPLYIDLRGVTALSANDVWAVGSVITDTHVQDTTHTVIAHWNGQRWSIVPSPNPGKVRNELWGVTALSANDVWAVGDFSNGTQGQIVEETLTLHWNGSRWSVVSSPSPSTMGNGLDSVTALSANDVWAVGYTWTSSENNLIEHWNGSRWSVVKTSNDQVLSAVALVPHSNTIVAVGLGSLLYIKDPGGESLSKP